MLSLPEFPTGLDGFSGLENCVCSPLFLQGRFLTGRDCSDPPGLEPRTSFQVFWGLCFCEDFLHGCYLCETNRLSDLENRICFGLVERLDSYWPLQALFPLSTNVALGDWKRVTTCP